MRILDRYILRQLWPMFALGVFLFAGIIFLFSPLREALELARETGLSQFTMWKILALRCPGLITYVFPIAMLFGCALLTGRMAEGGEIVAASMAGVSLASFLRWAFVFAALAGVSGAAFNEYVAVPALDRAKKIEDSLVLKEQGKVQRHVHFVQVDEDTGEAEFLVYAESFDKESQTLSGITVIWLAGSDSSTKAEPQPPRMLKARQALHTGGTEWQVSGGRAWFGPGEQAVALPDYKLNIGRVPSELDVHRHIERRLSAREIKRRVKEMMPQAKVNPNTALVRNAFLMEMWLRLAIPMACLPFALLGAPLGARPQGGGLSLALGLSVLASFLYYTLLRYAEIAGRDGRVPPVVAAWSTTVVALVVGLVLLRRSHH